MNYSNKELRELVEVTNKEISITRQCSLINLPRSSFYYQPREIPLEQIEIMHKIDRIYTGHPFYGSPRITAELRRLGTIVNHKRVERLMRIMGISAIIPKRNTSKRNKDHLIYPYLLRGVEITRINHVWSTDITYIPISSSFVYLVAVIDWFSRYVLSWSISNTLDLFFCLEALDKALREGKPEIFNTDQGSQFTSVKFTERLLEQEIKISMDSRGRAFDNIFIERLWRSLKYEDIYLKDYHSVREVILGIEEYFNFYNYKRPHQALNYKTPAEVYFSNYS
jgi:putative transposase